MTSSSFLLYGSYGYTGDLIAREALRDGLRPILAGRDRRQVRAQAQELGLPHRAFDLADTAALEDALGEAPLVLHCAGPYAHTYRPMVEGCLRTGTHYLDITGEIPVYEAIAGRDGQARSKGVMLLPGVGFDVLPSDCLAAHLKSRLPTATHLALAFVSTGQAGFSRGTARSMVEILDGGGKIRREGRLETVSLDWKTREIDFGISEFKAATIPWGDVFMAYHSTGIPNIENYMAMPAGTRRALSVIEFLRPALGSRVGKAVLKWLIGALPPGPTPEQRAGTRTVVWGEVVDEEGDRAVSRLHGPEPGYTWTPLAAVASVRAVLDGTAPPGFQTPARAFGADFILDFEGVWREDVDG
jgi:short subunit dehydrogenase-like uncharacterized protein